jgi:transcriptional regulator with XRE-family HTH domain
MRNQIQTMESKLKKVIAENLKRIMQQKGFSQSKLSEQSGIPQSTISDIIKEKFLLNAGKVQQLADALKVPKSAIDPSFKEHAELQKYHLELILEILDNLYFEGKKLDEEDKEKIKEVIRIVINK